MKITAFKISFFILLLQLISGCGPHLSDEQLQARIDSIHKAAFAPHDYGATISTTFTKQGMGKHIGKRVEFDCYTQDVDPFFTENTTVVFRLSERKNEYSSHDWDFVKAEVGADSLRINTVNIRKGGCTLYLALKTGDTIRRSDHVHITGIFMPIGCTDTRIAVEKIRKISDTPFDYVANGAIAYTEKDSTLDGHLAYAEGNIIIPSFAVGSEIVELKFRTAHGTIPLNFQLGSLPGFVEMNSREIYIYDMSGNKISPNKKVRVCGVISKGILVVETIDRI